MRYTNNYWQQQQIISNSREYKKYVSTMWLNIQPPWNRKMNTSKSVNTTVSNKSVNINSNRQSNDKKGIKISNRIEHNNHMNNQFTTPRKINHNQWKIIPIKLSKSNGNRLNKAKLVKNAKLLTTETAVFQQQRKQSRCRKHNSTNKTTQFLWQQKKNSYNSNRHK